MGKDKLIVDSIVTQKCADDELVLNQLLLREAKERCQERFGTLDKVQIELLSIEKNTSPFSHVWFGICDDTPFVEAIAKYNVIWDE